VVARKQQGGDKDAIIEKGRVPKKPSAHEVLRRRVLEFVGKKGGVVRWWELRQNLGGVYSTEAVREVVDELIAEGKLLEAWFQPPTRHEPHHWLVLPQALDLLPGVHKIRRCAGVVERG